MEELFEKLQRKEEALARFEEERRRGARAAVGDAAAGDAEAAAADAAMPQHETPKQRRERLEAERAEERHAALERRLQEAAERRERMLAAIRAAAAAPGAPGAAAQPGSCRYVVLCHSSWHGPVMHCVDPIAPSTPCGSPAVFCLTSIGGWLYRTAVMVASTIVAAP